MRRGFGGVGISETRLAAGSRDGDQIRGEGCQKVGGGAGEDGVGVRCGVLPKAFGEDLVRDGLCTVLVALLWRYMHRYAATRALVYGAVESDYASIQSA